MASSQGASVRSHEGKDHPRDSDSPRQGRDNLLKAREHSVEVTGLGVIASLIMAFGLLVSDGTLRLSDYLVFVAFLLVSAGGLVWRLLKLAPNCGTGRAGGGIFARLLRIHRGR
jgi:hypothetical protein